jgi:predicted transcriptional regulator
MSEKDARGNGESDAEVLVSDCFERRRLMDAFLDGSLETSDIEEIAGVSSSTAHRIKNKLVGKGMVEESERGVYDLTRTGEAIAHELESFCDSVENIRKLRPVLESTRDRGVSFDPSLFDGGVITTASQERPYEPARRFMDIFRETDELRLVVVSTATPIFSEEKQRMIAEGKETEVVCPESVVEVSIETVPHDIIDGLIENLTLRVHDDLPFSVALFDDRVGVAGHADDGTIKVFADTDDDEAYAWAERVYERYREESVEMFERFDINELSERFGFKPEEVLV